MTEQQSQIERIVLAGDMALSAGLALGSTTRGLLASTRIDVTAVRQHRGLGRAVKEMRGKALAWASQYVSEVDLVAYEEPANGKSSNVLPQYSMVTSLLWLGDDLGCSRLRRFWPSRLKKLATGSGSADKEAMIRAATKYAGREIRSNDEADALMLLKVTLEELTRPTEKQTTLL